jgi:hypothetical protein
MSSRSEPAIFRPDANGQAGTPGPVNERDARVSPIDPIIAALERHLGEDAVRLFLNALSRHVCDGDAYELVDALRKRGGEPMLQRLVYAFAKFPCPHCRRGLNACDGCAGTARTDDGRGPCQRCLSLGATLCDFCGGSGFATYGFVPEPLRAAVAAARTDQAAARSAELLAWPLPTEVARGQLKATRKVLAKELVSLRREIAVLSNAAQFVREYRAANVNGRRFSARVFSHIARAAGPARTRVTVLLELLARISRELAVGAEEPDEEGFEAERAEMFLVAAREAERVAARRATLFSGRM